MAAFVDTNILIYAFVQTAIHDPIKVAKASDLVKRLTAQREFVMSAQVLNEFTSNALRKSSPRMSFDRISDIIQRLSQHTVIAIDETLVQLALRRVQTSQLSYWDSLIVEAALRARATILYTEDMHHGTRFGTLDLINPFL